jgi:hypothetical protein
MSRLAEGFLEKKRIWTRPANWALAVFALVLLRLLMWWLFQHDLPHMEIHDGWYFYHGGDQGLYFKMAQDLLAGNPSPQSASAGWAFVLAGLLKFMGGTEYVDILPLIVIGNGLWLALVSIPVIAQFALTLTGSRWQAWLVTVCWTLFPYLLWLAFAFHRDTENLRNAYVSRQMWVNGITDGSSFLFMVLGVAMALRARQLKDWAWLWFLIGGLSMGWGTALRLQVFPVAAITVGALVLARQWKGAGLVLLGCLIGFAPQFWYDWASTGHPLNLPYFGEWLRWKRDGTFVFTPRTSQADPSSLIANLLAWVRRLPVVVVAVLAGGLVGLGAFVKRWGEDAASAIILFAAPVGSFGLHVVTYVYTSDPLRYTLPAISFGLPAMIWTAFYALDWAYRRVWGRTSVRKATI